MNYLKEIGEKILEIEQNAKGQEVCAVQLAVEAEIMRRKKIYKLKKTSGKNLPIGEVGSKKIIYKSTEDHENTIYHAKINRIFPRGCIKGFGFAFHYRSYGILNIQVNVEEESMLDDFLIFLSNVNTNLYEMKMKMEAEK